MARDEEHESTASESEYEPKSAESESESDSGSGSGSAYEESGVEEIDRPVRKGRKPRKAVPNALARSGSTSAAAGSAPTAVMPPPPASTRFASTGETAQGALAAANGNGNGGIRKFLTRSATDGATAPLSSSAISSAGSSTRPSSGVVGGIHVCDHPGCSKSFSKVGKLNRHKLSHTGARAFTCTYEGCNKTFARNDRLRRHWKIHQNEAEEKQQHTKDESNIDTKTGGMKEGDMKKRTIISIDELNSDFMSGSDVESIVPTAILRPAAAGGSSDSAQLELVTHTPSIAPAIAPAGLPPTLPPLVKFACTHPGCTLSFLLREHLKRHQLAVGHDPSKSATATTAAASTSSSATKRSYPCVHIGCFLTFDKAHKLREHAFVHTGIMPWICNMPIDNNTTTKDQTKTKHDDDDDDEDEQGEDEEDEEMIREKNSNQNETDVAITDATTAEAAADASPSVAPAADASSTSAPPATDTAPPAASSSSSSASAPASSPSLCPAGFMSRAQLLKHQRLHHGPGRFLCSHDGCGSVFNRFMDLRKHQTTVHFQAEMVCHICGVVARNRVDKRLHDQTHLTPEERDKFLLKCPFDQPPHRCEKRFTRRGNLNIHIRTHHDATWTGSGPVKTEGGESGAAPIVIEDDSGDGDRPAAAAAVTATVLRYPCPFPLCSNRKAYNLKSTLQRHLLSYHSLTKSDLADDASLAAAVEAGADKPAPPHPNSKRALSSRARVFGGTKPYRKRGNTGDADGESKDAARASSPEQVNSDEESDQPPPPKRTRIESETSNATNPTPTTTTTETSDPPTSKPDSTAEMEITTENPLPAETVTTDQPPAAAAIVTSTE